jgi:curved DNA-binding protein CbpA
MDPRNHYLVLQVQETAEPDVVRAAFRALARRYHPDEPTGSVERMTALNEAWSVLGNAEHRAAYDAALRARVARLRGIDARSPVRAGSATAPRPGAGAGAPTWSAGSSASTAAGLAGGTSPDEPCGPLAQRRHVDASPTLDFGRYSGWSLTMVARHDPDYLEWLARTPVGRAWRSAIDNILRARMAAAG